MMGKYDFLFSTPQNSYLDQALPIGNRRTAPITAPVQAPNRPKLSPEIMAALTGRQAVDVMQPFNPLPAAAGTSMQGRPFISASPIPLPTSKPSQYTGALPISKPPMPARPAITSGNAPDFVKMPLPAQPQAPAQSNGFLGGLLGDGFDDPKSQGILAASAALLEAGAPVVGGVAPSLGQALGQGLRAGMGAYGAAKKGIADAEDDEINRRYKIAQADLMERKKKTPTREQIQNGAFTVVTDPQTGEQKIVPNEEIIKYQKEMKALTKTEKKPVRMSTAAFKAEEEDFEALDTNANINQDIDKFSALLESGEMTLSAFDKPADFLATTFGYADEVNANRSDFRTFVKKLVLDSLRLNKGTQTEGDAQRATEAIFENINDENAVLRRLNELKRINERALANKKRSINRRRENEGVAAFDFSTYNDVKFKEVD